MDSETAAIFRTANTGALEVAKKIQTAADLTVLNSHETHPEAPYVKEGLTEVLYSINDLRMYANQLERLTVSQMRLAGCSWQSIGDVLGISRQAAHERFH